MRLALGILLVVTAAAADRDATEQRLVRAGVSAPLRARVHAAIDRGVRHLVGRQEADGRVPGPTDDWRRSDEGSTALAALALCHAGTPAARAATHRALAYLVPAESSGRWRVHGDVYVAGTVLLLLDASGDHQALVGPLADALAGAVDEKTGYWNHLTRVELPLEHPGARRDHPVLATSHVAALGLAAAARRGHPAPFLAWRRHLQALVALQLPSGSWSYLPRRAATGTFAAGTFQGLADLLLARLALGRRLEIEPELERAANEAVGAALPALHRDGAAFLHALRTNPYGRDWSLRGWSYFGLVTLMDACELAGVERIDGVPWYETAAAALLDLQRDDGGWGETVAATSFALLVLTRAAEAYRPGAAVAAAGAPADAAGAPLPLAAPDGVPLDQARALLDRFARALARRDTPLPELLALLAEVRRTWDRLAPAANGRPGDRARDRATWRRDAALLFVRALVSSVRDRSEQVNRRAELGLAAAAVLGPLPVPVSAAMRHALEQEAFRAEPWEFDAAFLAAAFGALARQGDPASVTWLAHEAVSGDGRVDRVDRTLAALRAIREFRAIPGAVRLDACRALVRVIQPLEDSARAIATGRPAAGNRDFGLGRMDPRLAGAARHWSLVVKEFRRTLLALALEPAIDNPASSRGAIGTGPLGVTAFTDWLRRHDDPARPPWRDR